MPVFWNWLESNSWRLTLGFATDSADAKRVLCSVQRLQFLCVELHFSPWTEWKMLATFKKISLRDLQCCVIKMTIYYFSQVLSPFFTCFDTRLLQGTEPFASILYFFSLKVFALCWDLGQSKVVALSYYWLHSFHAALFKLPHSNFRRTNPSWRGQGCDPCAKQLARSALHTNSTEEKLVKCANMA